MNRRSEAVGLALEDVLGDIRHARRNGDLGRVAVITFCDLRRWAWWAGEHALAQRSSEVFLQVPFADKASFLREVDDLIARAERIGAELRQAQTPRAPDPLSPGASVAAAAEVAADAHVVLVSSDGRRVEWDTGAEFVEKLARLQQAGVDGKALVHALLDQLDSEPLFVEIRGPAPDGGRLAVRISYR